MRTSSKAAAACAALISTAMVLMVLSAIVQEQSLISVILWSATGLRIAVTQFFWEMVEKLVAMGLAAREIRRGLPLLLRLAGLANAFRWRLITMLLVQGGIALVTSVLLVLAMLAALTGGAHSA